MAWQVDPFHTQVEFAAKHFGMMTVRGRFNEVSATGTVDPAHPESSSLEVIIDVASLNTHNAQRDNDLRSSYFLELEKYPTITFKSTRIEPVANDRYAMTGDLTIKGITKPVTLQLQRYGEINDARMGHRVSYGAEGEINRKDFGMEFDMFADNRLVVSHEIKIGVEAEVVERAEEPAAAAGAGSSAPANP
jgi:polyisoprenoid-binding protein YceI